MSWLKTTWAAVGTAVLAALAVFAVANARSHKKKAEKWQGKAVAIEEGNVVVGISTAQAASTQAKLHEEKAATAKKKAEARLDSIGAKDEDVADILARWGT